MDNQHRKISGYRELSQAEVNAMNKIKACGVELGALVNELDSIFKRALRADGSIEAMNSAIESSRWIGIGKDHLQQGLMALTRSVGRPDTFA